MYKCFFVLLFLLFVSCSKDETNPVYTNNVTGFILSQVNSVAWSADQLELTKEQNTLHIFGRQEVSNHSVFNSTELYFRIININQPGTLGIGENENGIQYFVKGRFTYKSSDNSMDEVYTAYYLNFSLMKINSITNSSIDAEFNMKLYNQDFTDSLFITNGRLNIEY